jgi:hypothetical protein
MDVSKLSRSLFLLLLLLDASAAFARQVPTVDWRLREVRCEVTAAADPTSSNATAARLGAERVAKERLQACLCRALAEVTADGGKKVPEAANGCGAHSKVAPVLHEARIEHEQFLSDGSVALVGSVGLDRVAAALYGSQAEAPVRLVVDPHGLPLGRALAARVKDESGRPLFFGPARYEAKAPPGVQVVRARAVAAGSVSDVIVSPAEAKKISSAKPEEGAVLFLVDE